MRIIVVFTLALLLNFSCKKQAQHKTVTTAKIEFKKEATLQLFKANKKTPIATLDIELAQTDYETQTGLMYRDKMAKNQGMLFMFKNEQPRSFYMKNTQIPLDIIYVNSKMEIVSIQKNAIPFNEASLPSHFPAQYVLEVNAGLSEKWQLKAGDFMSFVKL